MRAALQQVARAGAQQARWGTARWRAAKTQPLFLKGDVKAIPYRLKVKLKPAASKAGVPERPLAGPVETAALVEAGEGYYTDPAPAPDRGAPRKALVVTLEQVAAASMEQLSRICNELHEVNDDWRARELGSSDESSELLPNINVLWDAAADRALALLRGQPHLGVGHHVVYNLQHIINVLGILSHYVPTRNEPFPAAMAVIKSSQMYMNSEMLIDCAFAYATVREGDLQFWRFLAQAIQDGCEGADGNHLAKLIFAFSRMAHYCPDTWGHIYKLIDSTIPHMTLRNTISVVYNLWNVHRGPEETWERLIDHMQMIMMNDDYDNPGTFLTAEDLGMLVQSVSAVSKRHEFIDFMEHICYNFLSTNDVPPTTLSQVMYTYATEAKGNEHFWALLQAKAKHYMNTQIELAPHDVALWMYSLNKMMVCDKECLELLVEWLSITGKDMDSHSLALAAIALEQHQRLHPAHGAACGDAWFLLEQLWLNQLNAQATLLNAQCISEALVAFAGAGQGSPLFWRVALSSSMHILKVAERVALPTLNERRTTQTMEVKEWTPPTDALELVSNTKSFPHVLSVDSWGRQSHQVFLRNFQSNMLTTPVANLSHAAYTARFLVSNPGFKKEEVAQFWEEMNSYVEVHYNYFHANELALILEAFSYGDMCDAGLWDMLAGPLAKLLPSMNNECVLKVVKCLTSVDYPVQHLWPCVDDVIQQRLASGFTEEELLILSEVYSVRNPSTAVDAVLEGLQGIVSRHSPNFGLDITSRMVRAWGRSRANGVAWPKILARWEVVRTETDHSEAPLTLRHTCQVLLGMAAKGHPAPPDYIADLLHSTAELSAIFANPNLPFVPNIPERNTAVPILLVKPPLASFDELAITPRECIDLLHSLARLRALAAPPVLAPTAVLASALVYFLAFSQQWQLLANTEREQLRAVVAEVRRVAPDPAREGTAPDAAEYIAQVLQAVRVLPHMIR